MARSEILSLPCDVIPISDVSGLAFDLPRRKVWPSATFKWLCGNRSERMVGNPSLIGLWKSCPLIARSSRRWMHCSFEPSSMMLGTDARDSLR